MSIRQSLLTLLDAGPSYGYQLRADFERQTGNTWPVNIGQVYSTLERLERDGLIESTGRNADGQNYVAITEAGRHEVRSWFESPVPRTAGTRDELAIKLALAVSRGGAEVAAVIRTQRTATMRALQDLTRMKMAADAPVSSDEVAWALVLESLIFSVEAEIRWLDYAEATLAKLPGRTRATVEAAVPAPQRALR